MHFTPLSKTLCVALLCLIFPARGHESHYPVVRNDLHCPKGLYTGFVQNSYTYNRPLHKFTNITGSFFDPSWYGAPATNTTGIDNVPGATRSGSFGGSTFHETLTMYFAGPDVLMSTVHGKPWINVAPNQTPLQFGDYVETIRFQSICGGKATYIDVISYLCSDDQTAAYNLTYTDHMVYFETLAANIGATVLAGDCRK
ncbi:hypothetical protein DFH09DRAFT_1362658 [Mycena vulgaris]|nr:hypothetical protein DFH09DRAFT_1362658 [Mycena vulgaris]